MSETVDTLVVKLLFESEQATQKVRAYGASFERTMLGIAATASRTTSSTITSATKQSEAYRSLGKRLVGVTADAIAGKNAFEILGQHGTEAASSFAIFGGTVGRVATFLSGPWGAAITTAVSVAGLLATELFRNEEAAKRAADGAGALAAYQSDIGNYIDLTTGKIREQNEALIDNAILQRQQKIDAKNKAILGHRDAAAKAIRRAAIIEPTEEQRLGAARGSGDGAARYDPELLAILRTSKTVNDLYAKVKALAIRRPELAGLRDAVQLETGYAILARREKREAVTERDALTGDKAAISRLSARGAIASPAAVPEPTNVVSFADWSRRGGPPAAVAKGVLRASADAEKRLAGHADGASMIAGSLAIEVPSAEALRADIAAIAAAWADIDVSTFEAIDTAQLERIGEIASTLADDLSKGFADAILSGKSLGDVLVDSFARAGTALIQSKILGLLDPNGDGSAGFIKQAAGFFGALAGAKAPGRASGGHVSAGQLYRVNETGVEGFRPAGSGTIVPLGRMAAARPSGGVTVVQPLNVSFAGAITTPELMAQFKAYADGVGQAAVIGGAAMAQAKLARRAARSLPR